MYIQIDDQKRLDGVQKRYQATYREFGDSAYPPEEGVLYLHRLFMGPNSANILGLPSML